MSLKEAFAKDLQSIYNGNELALTANYDSKVIYVLPVNDIEISSSEMRVISAKASDVALISEGEIIEINSVPYEVINFALKDDYDLEMLISLEKV